MSDQPKPQPKTEPVLTAREIARAAVQISMDRRY
jgi:hypothetical protein